jgi:hypothetical protein
MSCATANSATSRAPASASATVINAFSKLDVASIWEHRQHVPGQRLFDLQV